jgi:electron transport complex protein RnfG
MAGPVPGNGSPAPAGPPAAPDVAPARLLATLGTAGAGAGILLVLAFGLTAPMIEANRARALDAAVQEVLKGPARYETLYVVGGALASQVPSGADPKALEPVYLGYRASGEPAGFAVVGSDAGFQDTIRLIVGYAPGTRALLGIKVLESKETPGLGDKIEKDADFVDQFHGAQIPLLAVKRRDGGRPDPREVHTITGATISSRAVIRIVNRTLERLGPLMEAYAPEAGR